MTQDPAYACLLPDLPLLDLDGALHRENQVPGAMRIPGPRQQQVIRVVSTIEQNEISEELWTVGL